MNQEEASKLWWQLYAKWKLARVLGFKRIQYVTKRRMDRVYTRHVNVEA